MLLGGLINENKRVRKLEPRGLVQLGYEEAERFLKAREDALLAGFESEDENAEEEPEPEEEEEEEEEDEEDLGADDEEEEENASANLTQPWQKCGDDLGPEMKMGRQLRIVPTGRTFAAFLRICTSLLWYGEKDKAEAVRCKLRELNVMQNICGESMRAGHFPFNIGAKVCILVEELLTIPANEPEEMAESIQLYEVAVKFMLDALKTTKFSFEKRLARGGTLTRREEGLLMRITSLWALLVKQVGAVCFHEDEEVDEVCDKFVGTQLFPIQAVNVLLLWLYYDMSLQKAVWGWDKQSLYFREQILMNSKMIVAAFLRNSPDFQFEILVHINRLQVQHNLTISPSYLCELLKSADVLAYQYAIASYLKSEGYSDHENSEDPPERVREFSWVWQCGSKDPIAMAAGRPAEMLDRLLVCTHAAIYVLRASWWPPCCVCTSDKFCPTGPVQTLKVEFSAVRAVMRGFGGNTLRLVFASGMFGFEETIDFICDTQGQVDRFVSAILGALPAGQVDYQDDAMTWHQLSINMECNEGQWKLDRVKEIIMLYNVVKMRPASRDKKTGEMTYHGKWELYALVLTAAVETKDGLPLEFAMTEDGFSSESELVLKQFICFEEDYSQFQSRNFSNEPSDTFVKQIWAAEPGDLKIEKAVTEEPILRLFKDDKGKEIVETKFGSTETMMQWVAMLHFYSEGGFTSYAAPPAGEEEAKGKKK